MQLKAMDANCTAIAVTTKAALNARPSECRHSVTLLKSPDQQVEAYTKAVSTVEAKIVKIQEKIVKAADAATAAYDALDAGELEKKLATEELDILKAKLEVAKINVVEDQKIQLGVPEIDPLSMIKMGIPGLALADHDAARHVSKQLSNVIDTINPQQLSGLQTPLSSGACNQASNVNAQLQASAEKLRQLEAAKAEQDLQAAKKVLRQSKVAA